MTRNTITWPSLHFLGLGLCLSLLLCSCEMETAHDVSLEHLRVEYKKNPVGIDATTPRFSWWMKSETRGQKQTAYQILVSKDKRKLHTGIGDEWDSGIAEEDASIQIQYQGKPLTSNTKYYWKVRVWDQDHRPSNWSEPASWVTGLFNPSDWKAQWIAFEKALQDSIYMQKPWANGMKMKTDYVVFPSPYLRTEFTVERPIKRAILFSSALGAYEAWINGQRVGSDYLTPGWTEYKKRVYYNSYDVTSMIQQGIQALGVIIADGWFAGNVANVGQRRYGPAPRFKCQLHIEYESGESDTIYSDQSWKASLGPILEADMQGGETYDARLELDGWSKVDFRDDSWEPVSVIDSIDILQQAYKGNPVRKIDSILPSSISKMDGDRWLVDFGQNFAGWAKIKVQAPAGTSIQMRFAEKLNGDSTLHTRNLRSARCTDTYTTKGGGLETWEPRFTYHGFQFVEVTGWPVDQGPPNIVGIVIHSDAPLTGSFECDNELINKLYSNILWSQRSNYIDVPTDCPQRDERMGWGGDAQLFMPTAIYNMDVASFFTKWMLDVMDSQKDDGRIPSTAPVIYHRVAAAWADAAIICPWHLYTTYGDQEVFREHYQHMESWVAHLEEKSKGHISQMGSFGDWQNVDSETSIPLIATAYYSRSTGLLAEMAELMGNTQERDRLQSLKANIDRAFQKRFLTKGGAIKGGTQTGHLLALGFNLVPEEKRQTCADSLVKLIVENDSALSTGIIGTSLLLPILSQEGYLDLAYHLLTSKKYPSWGHHIENGATTIWERWDGYSDDKGFHKDSTNSLNHYAYGSVGAWMFENIGGIKNGSIAFKDIVIRPQPGKVMKWARASYQSMHGLIESKWEIKDSKFYMTLVIPPNTSATVYLPTNDPSSITEGGEAISDSWILKGNEKSQEKALRIPSGRYSFECDYANR